MIELSKLISGFYCGVCGRSIFLQEFNEEMIAEVSKPSWLLKFVKEITKESKKEEETILETRKGLERWF